MSRAVQCAAQINIPAVMQRLERALEAVPIIAILRGLRTEEATSVVEALFEAGIRVAEVPLNSPDPFTTIRLLVEHFGDRMLLGAGTVTDTTQVSLLAATGAALCVMPNTDPEVIRAAIDAGLLPLPGYQTPTEAFAALAAGASYLKFFSAAGHTADLAALRAVLPVNARVIAVGGVDAGNAATLRAAGAIAFGMGSDLYRPGLPLEEIRARAASAVAMIRREQPLPVAKLVCNPQALIGESPIWRAQTQQVVWVDPLSQRLFCVHRLDSTANNVALSAPVWSLAALPSGQLGAAVVDSFAVIDEHSGKVHKGPVALMDAGCRFNDMTADRFGGLWAGAMHRGLLAGRGSLYYAPSVNHPPRQVASGLGVPNGMVFSADQRTLYVIDTLARNLLAYPVDLGRTVLGEPVVITDFMGLPGKPDGMDIAIDGSLWVAMWGGGCVVRIGVDGALLQQFQVPTQHVSSVCAAPGGTLFITTSRMRLSDRQLAESPGAGGIFAIETAH